MSNHKQDMVNLAAKHCKTLGIDPSEYDGDKLDEFYYMKCAEHHPDKGGDHEEFIKLKPARDWLRKNAKIALQYASEIREAKEKEYSHSSHDDSDETYAFWEDYEKGFEEGYDVGYYLGREYSTRQESYELARKDVIISQLKAELEMERNKSYSKSFRSIFKRR